jgi:hypothetical protein
MNIAYIVNKKYIKEFAKYMDTKNIFRYNTRVYSDDYIPTYVSRPDFILNNIVFFYIDNGDYYEWDGVLSLYENDCITSDSLRVHGIEKIIYFNTILREQKLKRIFKNIV